MFSVNLTQGILKIFHINLPNILDLIYWKSYIQSVSAFNLVVLIISSLPRWLHGKESACSAGDMDLIPGSGDPLEEGMATPSSILAWRTPWTEEPGWLQFIGSQRVRHDWSNLACMHLQ